MFIITNLLNLLVSNSLMKTSSINVRVNYTNEDKISIPDHVRLTESKLKLSFIESEKNDSTFAIGLKLGSLLSGSETIVYVTDSDELLQTEKVESGKATILFVKSFDEAVKVYEKYGNKTARKTRKKRNETANVTKENDKKESDHVHSTVNDENNDTVVKTTTENKEISVNDIMNPPTSKHEENKIVDSFTMNADEENETKDSELDDVLDNVPQKTLNGDFSDDPVTNIKNMLNEIDQTMVPAYRYIIDAIHDSKKPVELSYMLPMLIGEQFVEKWEEKLEMYFDQLKEQVDKVNPFSHMDDVYVG